MTTTPNPPAFEQAVRDWLADKREQFNYEQMLHTFLDTDRFRRWVQVLEHYHPLVGARFLSSGCGFGGSLLAYHDAGAASVTGVEIDPAYAEFARLRVADLPTADVRLVDDERLPFADESFDVIESLDVIEHTSGPQAYLEELARVLSPGGIVLLASPNRLWPVEQHLGVVGPPWLPVPIGDRLWPALARLPVVGEDTAFRFERLPTIREHNISMRTLRSLSKRAGLALAAVPRHDHPDEVWPLPRQPEWLERASRRRFASLVAPVRTLVALLRHT